MILEDIPVKSLKKCVSRAKYSFIIIGGALCHATAEYQSILNSCEVKQFFPDP